MTQTEVGPAKLAAPEAPSILGAPVRAWNRFWFSDVSGVAFGLVRIGFAFTLVLTLLEFAPLLKEHYTSTGYFPMESARTWNWGNAIALLHLDVFDSLVWVVSIFTGLLMATIALGAGWHSRTASACVFLGLLWFQSRNPTYLNGGDEVLRLTAFYLFLGYLVVPPQERSLSLDRAARIPKGQPDRWLGGHMRVWPIRMIQIQVCILYAVAGAWKLAGTSWWSGSALYYSVQNPQTARFALPAVLAVQPLYRIGSLAVAFWEFTFPVLFAWRRTRAVALAFGVAMHVGILLTMNIGFFSLAVLATYPALYGSDTCRRWLTRGSAAASAQGSQGRGPVVTMHET